MNTSLGKYQAYNTIIHKMDARIKTISMIIFMVSIFISYCDNPFMNLTTYAVIFLVILLIGFIAKVSFLSIFRSLLGVWVMVLFILVLNIFFTKPLNPGVGIAFSIGSLDIYWSAINNMLLVFSRLLIVIMLTNIYTSTTKPMEMTNALEWWFYPLSLIKVPIHKFAMAISLALRFVPTLQEEANKIMKAQASRGVDFKQGKFKEKVKSLISLIIPLFISSFTISGQLADAMEARGYDPDAKRTKYKVNKWSMIDTFGVIFSLCLIAGIVLMCIYKVDMYAFFKINVPTIK